MVVIELHLCLNLFGIERFPELTTGLHFGFQYINQNYAVRHIQEIRL
jgi:hypothetical protein